jgi:hypothetical protein
MIKLFSATNGGSPESPCAQLGGCLEGINAYAGDDTTNNIFTFIITISNLLTYLSAAVAVIFIIIGAYRMVTSNGDDSQYKKGVQTLIWAVAGLCLAILAYSIVYVIAVVVPNIHLTPNSTPASK